MSSVFVAFTLRDIRAHIIRVYTHVRLLFTRVRDVLGGVFVTVVSSQAAAALAPSGPLSAHVTGEIVFGLFVSYRARTCVSPFGLFFRTLRLVVIGAVIAFETDGAAASGTGNGRAHCALRFIAYLQTLEIG